MLYFIALYCQGAERQCKGESGRKRGQKMILTLFKMVQEASLDVLKDDVGSGGPMLPLLALALEIPAGDLGASFTVVRPF